MDPTLQNAMLLQAIKAGGQQQQIPQQGMAQAMGANPMAQAAAMGQMPQPQMSQPTAIAPTDPTSQVGGLGSATGGMPPGMMQQQNPVAAALMSQIPGVGQ